MLCSRWLSEWHLESCRWSWSWRYEKLLGEGRHCREVVDVPLYPVARLTCFLMLPYLSKFTTYSQFYKGERRVSLALFLKEILIIPRCLSHWMTSTYLTLEGAMKVHSSGCLESHYFWIALQKQTATSGISSKVLVAFSSVQVAAQYFVLFLSCAFILQRKTVSHYLLPWIQPLTAEESEIHHIIFLFPPPTVEEDYVSFWRPFVTPINNIWWVIVTNIDNIQHCNNSESVLRANIWG